MARSMETPRAFAALVCIGVACSSPEFSSVNDTPEPAAGRPGSAGGSAGKLGGTAAASGRGAAAGSGTVSNGGTAGATAGDGQGGNGGDGATGASGESGGSAGGTDATGGTGGDGGSSGATGGTGGATGAGGDQGSGGDAASGGTTGGAGGTSAGGGLGGRGLGGAAGVAGLGVGGLSVGGISGTAGIPGTGGAGGVGGSGGMLGGCDNQLLANADFEAGPTPSWQQESDKAGLEIIVPGSDAELMAEDVAPYAGSYLAWLGGIADNMWDHYDVILRQNVSIPEDASALTLSGFYQIKSEDSATVGYDVAYLEFETDAGTMWQAVHWTNVDQTSGWQPFTSTTDDGFQLDALRGRTVTFVAYSRTDPSGKTSFFLDNLKLEAECGR
jgi:hypothetical protein